MTVTEFLDQIQKRMDGTSALDADFSERRARYLEYLIGRFSDVWFDPRNFWFTFNTGTITIDGENNGGTGFGFLPSDFHSFGPFGGVTIALTGRPIDEVSPLEVQRLQADPGYRPQEPNEFALYGQDPNAYVPLIQTAILPADLSVSLLYKKQPPTLSEDTSGSPAENDNLKVIPAVFHQTVLIPGVRADVMKSKGQADWEAEEARFQKGLKLMQAEQRSRMAGTPQMPSYFEQWAR